MVQLPPAQLGDVVCHPLQKIAVVGHHHKAAPKPPQPVLQPGHHLAVQVVGWLVQNQDFHWLQQYVHQCHPFFLPAGKVLHRLPLFLETKLVQHGPGFPLQCPVAGIQAPQGCFQDAVRIFQDRRLRQISHFHMVPCHHCPQVGILNACNDFQQGGLPHAIHPNDAYFFPFLKAKGCVFQQYALCCIGFV